jgi:hypothetical protein
MPINEILPAVRKAYDTFDKSDFKVKCPPTDDLIYLLRSVLENNVFEFDGKLFIQKIGVAIGAVPSPECCDILMFQITKDIFSKFEKYHNIYFYGRYCDDGFLIYHGNENEIKTLFAIANGHHPLLKFTYEYAQTSMNFLDVNVYKGKTFENNAILDLKTYFKSTNSFMYLHQESCHSRHVFAGFIKGEAIRHICNTNDKNELQTILSSFKLNLIKRGYNELEIDDNINQELCNNRAEFLNKKSKKHTKEIPLVLSTKYNPCIRKIKQCLVKHWQLLKHNKIC